MQPSPMLQQPQAAPKTKDSGALALRRRLWFWWFVCLVPVVPAAWVNWQVLSDRPDAFTAWVMSHLPLSFGWAVLVLGAGLVAFAAGWRVLARYGPASPAEMRARGTRTRRYRDSLMEVKKALTAYRAEAAKAAPGLQATAAPAHKERPPLRALQQIIGKQPSKQGAALLVVHGIGIQLRFETMDGVVRGLTDGLSGQPDWQFELADDAFLHSTPPGCTEEDGYGKRLQRVKDKAPLDVYELYWAPMVEGLMGWKALLKWAASLLPRLARRTGNLAIGSKTLPHPDDVTVEQQAADTPEEAAALRAWVAAAQRDVKRKAWYEVSYIALLTGVAVGLLVMLVFAWRAGLGLNLPVPSAVKAIQNVADDLAREPLVQAKLLDSTRFQSQMAAVAGVTDPAQRAAAAKAALTSLKPDDARSPVDAICAGDCSALEKVRLAALVAGGIAWGDYFKASQEALLQHGFSTAIVLLLLYTCGYALVNSFGAFVVTGHRKATFRRIADLHTAPQKQRRRLRATARAVLGIAAYAALFTAAVLGGIWLSDQDPAGRVNHGLLGISLVVTAAGVAYLTIYAGLIPFLSRTVADVPLQADTATDSPGFKARAEIRAKAVAMLNQLLTQYESVMVLAHSQGTVVTYEAFQAYQQRYERQQMEGAQPGEQELQSPAGLKAYVTVGVALSKVLDLVQGYADPGASHRAVNEKLYRTTGIPGVHTYYRCYGQTRWYNYWLQSDLVCNPIRDCLPVRDKQLAWYTLPNPKSVWTHSDYWDAVSFYEHLVSRKPDEKDEGVPALHLLFQ